MAVRVEAWRVHDTGLVAAPGRFRRLPGRVRHHQGQSEPWPDQVVLDLAADELLVTTRDDAELGRWACDAVAARLVAPGPPVTFVLDVPGASHLLAAPTGSGTDALLAALARPGDSRQ